MPWMMQQGGSTEQSCAVAAAAGLLLLLLLCSMLHTFSTSRHPPLCWCSPAAPAAAVPAAHLLSSSVSSSWCPLAACCSCDYAPIPHPRRLPRAEGRGRVVHAMMPSMAPRLLTLKTPPRPLLPPPSLLLALPAARQAFPRPCGCCRPHGTSPNGRPAAHRGPRAPALSQGEPRDSTAAGTALPRRPRQRSAATALRAAAPAPRPPPARRLPAPPAPPTHQHSPAFFPSSTSTHGRSCFSPPLPVSRRAPTRR